MIKKRIQVAVWLFALLFFLLLTGFLVLHCYCAEASKTLRTYVFEQDKLYVPQDQLSISVSIAKLWNDEALHPEEPCGAQYDGVLANNSDYFFQDWYAELTFSGDILLDSSWNGTFTTKGNVLRFIAKDHTAIAKPHESATFGGVIYSTEFLSLKSCTVSGYRIIPMKETSVFWVLIVASLIWLIALVMYVVIQLRIGKFKKRQELDSAIIRQSMSTFTGFIDAKDTYTKGHSIRVAEYATEIARRMKMREDELSQLYYISLMHDCGKIGIPDAVLQKPGKLTDAEFRLIQSHTTTGDDILKNFTAIQDIRDGARFHHERFDGGGYPTGLRGDEIPLCARIICVADSFDAMSSNRCYRTRLSEERIIQELLSNAGKQFDPLIVPFLIAMIKDGFVRQVQEKYPEASNGE